MKYGEECRPIKLNRHYVGVEPNVEVDGDQIFKALMRTTRSIIRKMEVTPLYKENSILCFVQTRKQTQELANMFRSQLGTGLTIDKPVYTHGELQRLNNLMNQTVAQLLLLGIGIHHAGLQRGDRLFVEEMFGKRRIRMLISTTTLAAGINTSATVVFVVGTTQYDRQQNIRQNVAVSEVEQMMGRAGRIGNGSNNLTSATAYVITTKKDAYRYCHAPIEPVLSQLLVDENFEEMLNAHLAHCQGTDDYGKMLKW